MMERVDGKRGVGDREKEAANRGERAAIDAGLLPGLLPGGRPVAQSAARVDAQTAWGSEVPATEGRALPAILEALVAGELAGVVVGGLELIDLPNPSLARAATTCRRASSAPSNTCFTGPSACTNSSCSPSGPRQ